jgi:hypothetical protein
MSCPGKAALRPRLLRRVGFGACADQNRSFQCAHRNVALLAGTGHSQVPELSVGMAQQKDSSQAQIGALIPSVDLLIQVNR